MNKTTHWFSTANRGASSSGIEEWGVYQRIHLLPLQPVSAILFMSTGVLSLMDIFEQYLWTTQWKVFNHLKLPTVSFNSKNCHLTELSIFVPRCRQAGPKARKFSRRGVVNILPPFTPPKNDRSRYQAQLVLHHLRESMSDTSLYFMWLLWMWGIKERRREKLWEHDKYCVDSDGDTTAFISFFFVYSPFSISAIPNPKWVHRSLPYFPGSPEDKAAKVGLNASKVSLRAAVKLEELLEVCT